MNTFVTILVETVEGEDAQHLIPANGCVRLYPVSPVKDGSLLTNRGVGVQLAAGRPVGGGVWVWPGRYTVTAAGRRWDVDIPAGHDEGNPFNLAEAAPVDPATPLPWAPTAEDLLLVKETAALIESGDFGGDGSGRPGAVPTAGDYAIVGPGRPDVPESTGGLVSSSTPVGATYTSTDGAGVGAFVWRKRPDGSWAVVDGDTGWRTLPLIGEGHHSATRVEVRRQGATVRARALIVPVGSTSGDIATVPQGFKFSIIHGGVSGTPSVTASIRHGVSGYDAGTLLVSPNTISFTGLSTNVQRHLARTDWGADDPWPSTLHGTPA